MKINRRKTLLGISALGFGGGAVFGSGAFTQMTADRDITVEVDADSDALLRLEDNTADDDGDFPGGGTSSITDEGLPNWLNDEEFDDAHGPDDYAAWPDGEANSQDLDIVDSAAVVHEDGDGRIEVDIGDDGDPGVNVDSQMIFKDIIRVVNDGDREVGLSAVSETEEATEVDLLVFHNGRTVALTTGPEDDFSVTLSPDHTAGVSVWVDADEDEGEAVDATITLLADALEVSPD